MENLKNWIRKNGLTSLLVLIFVVLLVNKDAKAWLMCQVASTGVLNSKFSETKEENSTFSEKENINLTVRKEDGTVVNTSDLKGKVVFINFWASWCPPCRAEFPSIQAFYEKYKTNPDIIFLTVNLDDNPELGKVYLADKSFTVPFLIPEGDISNQYFSGSLPTTVVLDKSGQIQLHHQGLADYSKESFYQQIDELLRK
ncbi:TlpA disulfide reductase family protein [Chryseobacterium sp. BIGb0232]|uniref:TlpA family protein disulfide reductase n=1 Tax=Chryseobacterium sp. BIGb0232 TaxID=2940598 RepID=UPI000F4764D8|nr:TlpA disulfide reductase family protein [Chryseobacterium sp. BIGb0232]MCS4302740.1 thiol-disulfide isomerase/thioredoxin [Chryseobacterium sp. BIGb0232]ROS17393.1 thiol-disulfide isomerase/thioredoxin [Chryseobacterium nakagawai]